MTQRKSNTKFLHNSKSNITTENFSLRITRVTLLSQWWKQTAWSEEDPSADTQNETLI